MTLDPGKTKTFYVVAGEAGSGRTRLVEDFQKNAGDRIKIFGRIEDGPLRDIYAAAKAGGYKTHAMICHAPESVRRAVAQAEKRNGGLFPKAVVGHMSLADSADLYWRDTPESSPRPVASLRDARMRILDPQGYAAFVDEIALGMSAPVREELAAGVRVHKPASPRMG